MKDTVKLPEPYTRRWINAPFTERLLFTEEQMWDFYAKAVKDTTFRLSETTKDIELEVEVLSAKLAQQLVENTKLRNRITHLEQRPTAVEASESRANAVDKSLEFSQAALDVLAERKRQIDSESWTPEKDDLYSGKELATAAVCYAMYPEAAEKLSNWVPILWPWDDEWWKPAEPRKNYVKACALLLAEIERLDRKGKQ